jgi:hypothetical protein
MISCAIVATNDNETLSPAKKATKSCECFFAPDDAVELWRDDRLGEFCVACASDG